MAWPSVSRGRTACVASSLGRPRNLLGTSALVSVRYDPNSRKFYERKRAEGKKHIQAVLALARRRVNVIWALIRDRRCYEVTPPVSEAA